MTQAAPQTSHSNTSFTCSFSAEQIYTNEKTKILHAKLQHLVDEKVLRRIPSSEWAFPTFLIPEKDGRVRWISDFRRLNVLLKRPRYFLPSIPAIMQKRAGFSHITKLDISMGFYTFELDTNTYDYLWV